MTAQCPLCRSEISEDNPAFALDELATWVKSQGGWDTFESDHHYSVGKEFKINDAAASVVAKKTDYDPGEIDRDGYYGSELPQGTTFNVWVVIKFRGNLFRKTGTGDSYAEISWDGELLPVVAKTKMVEVYEYA